MKKRLNVHLKRVIDDSYGISFDISIRGIAKDILHHYPDSSIFVITDTNVYKYYGKYFRGNKLFHIITVPAGEKSKRRTVKNYLEDRLLSMNVSRNSVIVALGGGMVGDLAGFVAATMLRGIPYVQVPTSLLAQVDSSIGGKVAVDHPLGKNLIGAFYQPKRVYIDVNTLGTLPDREFRSGLSEVVKYGAILDADFFRFIESLYDKILRRDNTTLTNIIRRCCELKKMIVEQDEKETGLRRILNFGHTIGHAVELLSGYRLLHGEAIAIGMMAEATLSASLGNFTPTDTSRLWLLLRRFGLPTEIPFSMDVKKLVRHTLHDKKALNRVVHYTLLKKIGKATVGIPVSSADALLVLRR